jgi:hypothetical protein
MNEYASSWNEISFKDFLFKNKRNKRTLIFSAIAIVIQFGIFKYLYPYANYIHGDSFSYINAAEQNLTISFYPIGYSKFLRLFSVFSKPDIVLVGFQYLFIQCSALFLAVTVFYFYKVSKATQIFLFCFMVFNPLFLHLANLISSDGLFLGLSFTWFSLLLWIIHRPSNKIIFWHAVVFFIAFTVRYNALLYPFIAGVAFGLSKLSLQKKLIGLSLAVVLCGWFIGLTMYQYKKLTGYWQFSPFSGWQLSNNALFAYRYVDDADRVQPPKNFYRLDTMVTKFFDKTSTLTYFLDDDAQANTFYMWTPDMPLMRYKDSVFRNKDQSVSDFRSFTSFKQWATMGPLYKSYGSYLIRNYPLHFAAFFLWPNFRKYFAPPIEFLQNYNSGTKTVVAQAETWFGYKTTHVKTRMKNQRTWVLNFYPILTGIVNFLMLVGLIYYILLKGWKHDQAFNKNVILGCTFWLGNAFFTVFASSVALRFQSFPIILTTFFASLFIDWLFQLMQSEKIARTAGQLVTE